VASHAIWRRGWGLNPEGRSLRSLLRGTNPPDRSRVGLLANRYLPQRSLPPLPPGGVPPRSPLPLWVRSPYAMMPRQPNKGRHGIMAEGVGLEPTRGLRPAGFRDRSL